MKTLFSLGFIILLSQNSFTQNLKLRVYNKTGYNIDSLQIGNIYVGKLPKDSSYLMLNIPEIGIQDEVPQFFPYGILMIKGKSVRVEYHTIDCAHGKVHILKSGNYEFDLTLGEVTWRHGYDLWWDTHQNKNK